MPISVQIMTIPGAPVEGVNPLPMFHYKGEIDFPAAPDFPAEMRIDLGNRSPILPYKMQDRYSRKRIPLRRNIPFRQKNPEYREEASNTLTASHYNFREAMFYNLH